LRSPSATASATASSGVSLTPIIDHVFPMSQIVAAHQRMESNANTGKIVLTVD
jgi:NADPH:quinone reductase-like Zn-dependent oxidoreductase